MLRILNVDPAERIEMGKKARQKIIREYDKQIVINAYFRAIDEVVQKHKS
jgi:hypothetical protein